MGEISTDIAALAPPSPTDTGDDDLSISMLREQYRSLATLVPYLYVVVIVSTILLAYATRNNTPVLVTLVLPAPLLAIAAARLKYWVDARRDVDTRDLRRVRRDIVATRILGPGLTSGFMLIGLVSISTGDFVTKLLVLAVIWIASVASAFCLFVLPRTAMLVVTAAGVPLIVIFAYQCMEITTMLAIVIFVVSALINYILRENFRNFTEIVRSRALIAEKHRQAELARDAATDMAFTDLLTGLSNRRHFEALLDKRIHDEARAAAPFAVGMLDLDGFKPVNDVYGHAAGDSVLRQVARRLAAIMKGRGSLARMGGDEFAVIVENVGTASEANACGRDLQSCFDAPFLIGTRTVSLKATCGFCLHTSSGDDPSRLVDRADIALYRLKTRERGGIAVFDAHDETMVLERARIEQALRSAIAADAIEVHFQPIIELETGAIRGFESLARWTDPQLGPVSPAVFIPIAEQIGLIEKLTERLLRKAATVAAKWPAPLSLSFNISADQLSKPDAGEAMVAVLDQCGLSPTRFEAEITETAIMKDILAAKRTINALRGAGIRVSLDDFGTGYSSLSQVRALPLDRIKIDRSFVNDICHDARTATLVRSIIEMCQGLGLGCVAEGIESQDQLDILKADGCRFGQGYLISRPVPAEAANRLVQAQFGDAA